MDGRGRQPRSSTPPMHLPSGCDHRMTPFACQWRWRPRSPNTVDPGAGGHPIDRGSARGMRSGLWSVDLDRARLGIVKPIQDVRRALCSAAVGVLRIPERALERGVSKSCLDGGKVQSAANEVDGREVAEVVEPEIRKARGGDGRLELTVRPRL